MRVFLFIVAAMCAGIQVANSQEVKFPDLIVTLDNDSIACKILNESDQQLEVLLLYDEIEQEAIVLKEHTLEVLFGYYMQSVMPLDQDELVYSPPTTVTVEEIQRRGLDISSSFLRFDFKSGYSRRLGYEPLFADPSMDDHHERLRSGYFVSTGLGVFVNENWGVGMRYNFFRSRSAENEVQVVLPGVFMNTGTLEQEITIRMAGPELIARLPILNDEAQLVARSGLFYAWFQDVRTNVVFINTTGESLALNLGMDLDYLITEHIAFNLNATLFSGTVVEIEETGPGGVFAGTVPPDQGESLNLFNIGAGITILF